MRHVGDDALGVGEGSSENHGRTSERTLEGRWPRAGQLYLLRPLSSRSLETVSWASSSGPLEG